MKIVYESFNSFSSAIALFKTHKYHTFLFQNTRLVIWIESARGLLDMPRILASALNLHKNSGFFKLDAVVFGSDDYCADIGAQRSADGNELVWAR